MTYKEADEYIKNNRQYIIDNIALVRPAQELKGFMIAPSEINVNQKLGQLFLDRIIKNGEDNNIAISEITPQLYWSDKLYPFIVLRRGENFITLLLEGYLATFDKSIEEGKAS